LFSRADVAGLIDACFEPVWEMVRTVPRVTIDFGNGRVVRRTLHGNIATYVCNSDGKVLDVLPGIYEPQAYMAQLTQFTYLAKYVKQAPSGQQAAKLSVYHEAQRAALAKNQPAPILINTAGISKRAIEERIILAAMPAARQRAALQRITAPPVHQEASQLASWELLATDTRINETRRRLLIHAKLANGTMVAPAAITRWVYKDVLHTDLDDPYLGLGKLLFSAYPFEGDELH